MKRCDAERWARHFYIPKHFAHPRHRRPGCRCGHHWPRHHRTQAGGRRYSKKHWIRLQKIASRVPGTRIPIRLRPDGSARLPFASEAIREIFRVSPEEVREDAFKLFAQSATRTTTMASFASIQKSARDLNPVAMSFG